MSRNMTRKTAMPIHRKFIKAVVVVALVITALGARQAQAQTRDTELALAALLGLAVVGVIIAGKRDDDRTGQVITRNRPHHDGPREERRQFDREDQRYHRDRGIAPRPLPQRVQRHLLPAKCQRKLQTHHGGKKRVFGGRCLARNYAFANRLPRECAQNVSERGHGRATVWDARCLKRNGYRISRR